MRRIAPALAALVLAFAAGPLAAYTIYLKDGSKIVSKSEYRVEGDKAIITLLNGTESFLGLSEIDVARTRAANQSNLGSAVVLEGSQARALPTGPAEGTGEEKSLQDLIQERTAGVRALPEARRDDPSAAPLPRTQAGWIDLAGVPRRPFDAEEVATEARGFYRGQGLDGVKVFQGTAAGRLFVEIPASNESAVFRALAISANALLHLRDRFGDRVGGLELLLLTPAQERGGQFVLGPDQAADLAARRVEPAAFFLANVQF